MGKVRLEGIEGDIHHAQEKEDEAVKLCGKLEVSKKEVEDELKKCKVMQFRHKYQIFVSGIDAEDKCCTPIF